MISVKEPKNTRWDARDALKAKAKARRAEGKSKTKG